MFRAGGGATPRKCSSSRQSRRPLLASGNSLAAIEQFQIAIKLDPNHAERITILAPLARKGELAEAIVNFEQAVRLSPERDDIRKNLANALQQAGRPGQAVEHYQALLRFQPDDLTIYASLVKVLAAADRSEEAIATAEKESKSLALLTKTRLPRDMEEWLKHYQTELRRAGNAESNPQSNPSNQ